jgi:hypothetical protein
MIPMSIMKIGMADGPIVKYNCEFDEDKYAKKQQNRTNSKSIEFCPTIKINSTPVKRQQNQRSTLYND